MRDEFKKLLTDEAKKNKLDFKDKLAGIIEKETGYSEESKENCASVVTISWCI